jgi:MFS family permease
MQIIGLQGAYWVALFAMAGVGAIALNLPDLEASSSHEATPVARPTILNVVRNHAGVFLTLGLGVGLVSAIRASRQVVIPLWAEHLGFAPAAASLIFGVAAAIDMAVFYPAGKLMDQRGRIWVAVPSTLLMGLSIMLMSFTTGLPMFLGASMLLGLGNGIGSGIVMTLGADASPRAGRAEFLGIWRMLSDIGASGGPVLLSAIAAATSLATGMMGIGALGLVAAAVFWRWIPSRPSS